MMYIKNLNEINDSVKPNVLKDFKNGMPTGWCCGEARTMLKELIENTKAKTVVEIGSFKGQSVYYMASLNDDTVFYCVDHWKGSPEHYTMGIDCAKLFETFIVNTWEYRNRIYPLKMSSLDGLNKLRECNIKPEIIYVDGGHDAKSVYDDIKSATNLFPDAIICGDDYTLKGVRDGIDKFLKENKNVDLKTYADRVWRLRYK